MIKRPLRFMGLFLALAGCLPRHAAAQPWLENLPADRQVDFFEIQRAFENWWAGRDHTEKGKGWKAFKRWEWFWEQRVTPDGRFPDPMQLFNESRTAAERRARTSPLLAGSWPSL